MGMKRRHVLHGPYGAHLGPIGTTDSSPWMSSLAMGTPKGPMESFGLPGPMYSIGHICDHEGTAGARMSVLGAFMGPISDSVEPKILRHVYREELLAHV